jgi:hypothetical protein
MARVSIEIPDPLVVRATAAHLRRMARLSVDQRADFVFDARYARSVVISALRGMLIQDTVEGKEAEARQAIIDLNLEVDAEVGP